MDVDKKFLGRAVCLAIESVQSGGGPFGAVIVSGGRIISESGNKVVLLKDPTAHAEILAIREAARILENHDLSGCILYSSCEPCPMCLGAIYWSGIERIVYASDRYDASKAGFSDNEIYREICLGPEERKIIFHKVKMEGAEEAFKRWERLENKIPY
ncbi:MAG: nucleoside deaminase [Bacteroidales bacterium]|nr:nucleoside deaminase [Bacteroidales bacterium]